MNWVTTNIRLPEEDYMELKMEAAKKRVSIAHLIRKRVMPKRKKANQTSRLLEAFHKVANNNAKKMKGQSLSKLVIKMRYEQ
jgi:predicted HicB family RNase H-like nuclease